MRSPLGVSSLEVDCLVLDVDVVSCDVYRPAQDVDNLGSL